MQWLSSRYGPIDLYITENGMGDFLGNLDDLTRIYYYKHYINELLKGSLELGKVISANLTSPFLSISCSVHSGWRQPQRLLRMVPLGQF